ncbi:restriction endonuclease subunit S [Streptomyces sp. NPDC050428]|uniref:restriction endonuclease subunit S n=1 Tax=Streptomyces sp. NPDC050428 TaxID=3155757 RepID=UPI003447DC26
MIKVKPSRLGWAAALPEHWDVVPLGYVAKMGTGHTPDRNKPEYWKECNIPWVTTTDVTRRPDSLDPLMDTEQKISALGMANSAAVLHPADTVMLSRTASVGYSVRIGQPMATNQAFVTWLPGPRLDSRYLLLVLRTMKQEWQRLAYGSTHLTIYMPDLDSIRIPLPPLEEQRRIADFLDAETAHLEALVSKRSRQIEGLAERELALIVDMLSGGWKSGKRKPTGWPWLPKIPAEWSVGPVYAYFSTELGKMLNAERASGPDQRPYLRNANVHWYTIETDDLATMDFSADEVSRYSARQGDLLVCEGGAGVAEAAVWDGRLQECYFQKSLHRVRRAGPVPVEWLMYWLRLAKACGVFEAEGNIATIPHLTGEQLRQYRIPIPIDGDSLVKRTGEEIARLTSVRTKLRQAQTLLAERRQALITAAVTGQFDVSTASGRGIEE